MCWLDRDDGVGCFGMGIMHGAQMNGLVESHTRSEGILTGDWNLEVLNGAVADASSLDLRWGYGIDLKPITWSDSPIVWAELLSWAWVPTEYPLKRGNPPRSRITHHLNPAVLDHIGHSRDKIHIEDRRRDERAMRYTRQRSTPPRASKKTSRLLRLFQGGHARGWGPCPLYHPCVLLEACKITAQRPQRWG